MKRKFRAMRSGRLFGVLLSAVAVLACGLPTLTGPATTGGAPEPSPAMSATSILSSSAMSTAVSPIPTDIGPTRTASVSSVQPRYRFTRYSDPDRTVVTDEAGRWLATFTDHAYTVTLTGPQRTFSDPNARQPVVTEVWVRVLPTPFSGTVNQDWLAKALRDTSPDVFAVAMQYVHGAPPVTNSQGLQIAGSARYGPVAADDTREEGGDFNDYLGIPWQFGTQERQPKSDFFRSLDCSGFMRMVWGYRAGLPLTYAPNQGQAIPRHSWEILSSAPGVIIIPDTERQVTDFSHLAPGDLVFFHAKTEDHNPQVDHVGMYLGKDAAGHYRFISSRQTADGPTLGDVAGSSLLDGTGLYAKSFRAARRL